MDRLDGLVTQHLSDRLLQPERLAESCNLLLQGVPRKRPR
jgi:hypothetical protein